jgi:hypothetical protein
MKILNGHRSFETAYKIENYPWGFRLKTTQYVWIETVRKKGDRVIRQTIDPRTGKLCAAKCSTFSNIKWLYMDEKGHVQSDGLGIYNDKKTEVKTAIERIGLENLLPEQVKQYNALIGINEVVEDEFTGKTKKDFSVKWERETIGQGWKDGKWNNGEKGKCDEVKITFDRPDGVKLIEIFRAMKSLNQDRLNEVFTIRHSETWGDREGIVRICIRGGFQLTTVSGDSYREWLASDANVMEQEQA